jgi:hypothetical protein
LKYKKLYTTTTLYTAFLHYTNSNSLENFSKKAGKTIKASASYSDSAPVHKMSKDHCKIFLQRRGVELHKKDLSGLGPFTNATLETLRQAVESHKNDPVVTDDEVDGDGADEQVDGDGEEDSEVDEEKDEDEERDEAAPSVPCPTSNFDTNSGEVNEIKVKQVLSWLLDAPTDSEVLVRLKWLSKRYPTLKSYCTYLRYSLCEVHTR